MNNIIKALESNGYIYKNGILLLEKPLENFSNTPVRVIVFIDDNDFNEKEWLSTASRNPSFDFLNDPKENIYTLEDGKPFYDY